MSTVFVSNFKKFSLFLAVSPEEEQSHFEEFFEDVFIECEEKVYIINKINNNTCNNGKIEF